MVIKMNEENPEVPICYFVLDPRKYPKEYKRPFAPNEFLSDCCMGCVNKYHNGDIGDLERVDKCQTCITKKIDRYYRKGEPFTLNRTTGKVTIIK